MRLLFLLVIVLSLSTCSRLSAQSAKGARILILVPDVTAADTSAQRALREMEQKFPDWGIADWEIPDEGIKDEAMQLRAVNKKVLARIKSPGVPIAAMAQDLLWYYLFETSPGITILVDEHGRHEGIDSLRSIARIDSMDYVLSLRSLVIGQKISHMDIAVYEARTDSLLLKSQVSGNREAMLDGIVHHVLQTLNQRHPMLMQGR